MDTQNYMTLMETSRVTGVPYWRIIYAHRKGAIPRPARIVGTWAYGPEDIERITLYFAAKKAHRRDVA